MIFYHINFLNLELNQLLWPNFCLWLWKNIFCTTFDSIRNLLNPNFLLSERLGRVLCCENGFFNFRFLLNLAFGYEIYLFSLNPCYLLTIFFKLSFLSYIFPNLRFFLNIFSFGIFYLIMQELSFRIDLLDVFC